ncbi:MAG TPA: DUF1254 domain-containing protein [Capillimicrobium sp.]|nr:DUF1254 domain-containing protein [Capillimicrobium sp.]
MARRAAAGAVLALAALQLTTAGAPAGPAAVPSVPACALGRLPSHLADVVPRALAGAQRRYVATLTGASPAERRQAGTVFSAAAAAYVYGMPRVLLARTIERYPRNALVGRGVLATPELRTVVAPNHDTLYFVTRLDLRDGPVVLDAPATGGRYSVVQLLDIDTNAFAYVGSGTDRDRAETVVIAPPGWSGPAPEGARVIASPSTLAWLLGRTLVDGEADVDAAATLMRGYALTPLDAWASGARQALQVVTGTPDGPPQVPRGRAFVDALTQLLEQSPPPAHDACAVRAFARAGVGTAPPPGDLAAAVDAGIRAGDRLVDRIVAVEGAHAGERNNGWWLTTGDTAAFGRDYARRALVARIGLGANLPAEALYPVADGDSRGRPLDGRHRYEVRFAPGTLPPVRSFWSLTMYDEDLALVANPLGRYALGDRTPGLRPAPDGSLTIRISHAPPADGDQANWLPAPSGPFRLYLRLYEPHAAALDGRWTPPPIRRMR